MLKRSLFLAGGAMLAAGAAHAQSITVLGTNADAMACYRAADSELRRPDAVRICGAALASRDLNDRDRMATFVNRGIVQFRLDNQNAAIADFDAALTIEPGQPDALINRGIAMIAGGADLGAATATIEQGLAGRPQRPWVGYYGLAVAHELAGRDAQAYRDYRRARDMRPGWSPAELALSRFTVRGF
ncbi:MAG: hypothetical protein KF780_08375 [Sphingomonas sp.]|nr:hypothetical protein [Sphingomonas sp.]